MKRLSLFITLIALIGFSATAQQSEMLPKKAQVQAPKRMAGQRSFPALPASTRDVDTLVWFSNIQPCDTGAVSMWYFDVPHNWLTGHNQYIDSAKAEHYSGITGDKIVGLWAFFGDATYTNTATQKCHLRVWDDNGVDGSPGTRLASVDITHAKIAVDVAAGNITQVFFATPLTLPAGGNFYAGVELDYKLKQGVPTWDSTRTVGLYNTASLLDGDPACTDSLLNSAWEKWSDGTWHPYNQVYPFNPDGSFLGVRNYIFPLVTAQSGCTAVSITPTSAAICKGKSTVLTASGATTYSWAPSAGLNCTTCAAVTAAPTKTTTYTVTGDGGACSGTVKVTVNKPPTVTVTQAPCSGGAVLLTANATPSVGVTYQWFKGNAQIAGATNKTYSATVTKTYKCAVTITSTGCNKTSAAVSVTINCKMDGQIAGFDASVYPNPFSKSMTLNIATGSNDPATVLLMDYTGRTIREYSNVAPNLPFEISEDINAGVYFLKVIQGKDEKMLKVVKND